MLSVIPEVEKVCSMLMEKKLIYCKNNEVGVVVFGIEETKNELTKEVGGYENIVVLQDIKVFDGDTIDTLQKLPHGTVDGLFGRKQRRSGQDHCFADDCPRHENGKYCCEGKVWVYKKTHQVKVDDSSEVVPPQQRIKGYHYGPQVVPISAAEWDVVKFKLEKGVKLLAFTDASNIIRAILAVSATASAMKEMNKRDLFYFNALSFPEDVREYQFPSFNSFPASWQPNEQQQKAADELVQMLNLAPAGKEEALLPEFTPNPVLERFYHHLELKSKQLDEAVPPLDETLKRITEPDLELLRGKPSGSNEEDGNADASDAQAVNSIGKAPVVKIEKIGNLTPVQDFEAIMSRREPRIHFESN
ncbi:hypothetical protein CRYUN_Cryun01aG0240800 [Craigia yunnanensis]